MWTPNIVSTQRIGNQIKITVGYQKDTGELTSEDYYFSQPELESLKTQIRGCLTRLNAQDAFTLPLGVIDPTAAPLTQTQADIDQAQFIQDYQLWLKVKHGIDVGVLTGNETQVINLKNKVQSEFKASYLNLL